MDIQENKLFYGAAAASGPTEPPAAETLRLAYLAIAQAASSVFWVRADGGLAYVNAAAAQLLEYSQDELLACSFSSIWLEGGPEQWTDRWQQLRTRALVRFDATLRRRSGTAVPVEMAANALDLEGRELVCLFVRDMSERRAGLAALAANQARLLAVIENTEDAIWSVDCDYRLLAANSSFQRTTEKFLKRPLQPGELVLVDPYPAAYQEIWRSLLDRALAGERVVVEMPSQIQGPGNIIENSLNPIYDAAGAVVGAVVYSRNVSERRAVERELYESGRRLHSLIDNSDDVIFFVRVEPGGRFVYELANSALARFVGIDPAVIPGKTPHEVFPADHAVALERFYQACLEKRRPVMLDSSAEYGPSTTFWRTQLVPIANASGQIDLLMGIGVDITQLKQTENELRNLNESLEERVVLRTQELQDAEETLRKHVAALEAANAQLEQAAILKDQFLAMVSHELRTPLTAILGLGELLHSDLYGQLTEKQRYAVALILDSGEHLRGLFNDLIDMTKIEAGVLEVSPQPCLAPEIGQRCITMVRQAAERKRQQLTFAVDNLDIRLMADPLRLQQILINLLNNAIKFTPEGGRVALRIASDRQAGVVHFSVEDTGIGISPADLPNIFTPFFQADSSLAREYGGIGLGLPLVYHLVRLHQGQIEVSSVPGLGTCFTVTLPWTVLESVAPAQLVAAAAGAAVATAAATPSQVLLVDDSITSIEVFRRMLAAGGYAVAIATSGEEALRLVAESVPALVLMDIQMPGIGGLEAIRRIRASQRPDVATVPIVALTALAMAGDRERCLDAGADGYLSKPVSMPVFLEAVRSFVRSGHTA